MMEAILSRLAAAGMRQNQATVGSSAHTVEKIPLYVLLNRKIY